MSNETEKITRERTHKLTDNPAENVKNMAAYRLNKAIDAIEVFGQCSGDKYDWSKSAITVDDLEALVYTKVETAFANIRNGKKIVELAVKL